ncbi:MAG TPA: aldo/keto reductase [Candidatus Paenalcaligenes intestinipullorum]|uniref:Aldo/keto reductase n=1 Tax=Candidatus Paenalcaligenes intestinipullorum TaxID=2838718 RepID=A0A9D2RFB9_9BURK|nr:aldo/keto reductase [Candidatus Paenalcaligenes intestinipullorum]
MPAIPELRFHDGRSAPQLGFGVWQVDNLLSSRVVLNALENGYRLIDTASGYHNEEGVGRAISESGLDRSELFITTKLWNDQHGHQLTKEAIERSLEKLKLDYLDLYLIHWPVPRVNRFVQAWEMMINLRSEGLIKSIGVCNFTAAQLQTLLDKTGVLPVLNQVELHPRFQQQGLRQFHDDHDIRTQAWSPLAAGTLWGHPLLEEIARKHQRTTAQVLLRWHIEQGHMVLSKSVNPERQRHNRAIFSFELDTEDLAVLAQLNEADGRLGPHPETFHLPQNT